MATRFYLDKAADTVPISPTPDAGWEDTSLLARVLTDTTKSGEALSDLAFTDASGANRDILFRQYISPALAAGQTITGAQAIKAQCRCQELLALNNMFLTVGIRVIASDGTTVQKTVLAVTRDNVEINSVLFQNRQFTATSAVTNYTTVGGDRLVLELGTGGDPAIGGTHDTTLRLGSSAAFDLAEDDAGTGDDNPWIELTDTLTFSTAVPRSYGVVIG
jgi:hypothetical protein